jgi:hypothetical protein
MITNVLLAIKQRVDSKNGNGDGLIDYNEFLPWYTSIAEKHYKFMMANEQIESPKIEKKSPSFQRSAPPPPVSSIHLPFPSHCLPLKIILVLLPESPARAFRLCLLPLVSTPMLSTLSCAARNGDRLTCLFNRLPATGPTDFSRSSRPSKNRWQPAPRASAKHACQALRLFVFSLSLEASSLLSLEACS